MLRLKAESDLRGIWRSGQIAGEFLDAVGQQIAPGVSSAELDSFAREFIGARGGTPAFLGYHGFPGAICTSFNEQIVHGIPGTRKLQAGDVISVDVGVILDGYYSDTARTFFVGNGEPPADIQRLFQATEASLYDGIAAGKAGQPLRLISRAIQQVLDKARLGIIRELTGHGVGFQLHEEPTLYNFDPGARRPFLTNGMVIAIEPMASLGRAEILQAPDHWTYYTKDGSLAAHFEHTVACWDDRLWILTDPHNAEARARFGAAEA
jgi:methionyl aminopeptidase